MEAYNFVAEVFCNSWSSVSLSLYFLIRTSLCSPSCPPHASRGSSGRVFKSWIKNLSLNSAQQWNLDLASLSQFFMPTELQVSCRSQGRHPSQHISPQCVRVEGSSAHIHSCPQHSVEEEVSSHGRPEG